MLVRFYSLETKKLKNANLSHLSPVITIGGKPKVVEVVSKFSGTFGLWSTAGLKVVCFEEATGSIGGGDDGGLNTAEFETYDGTIKLRETP